VTSILAPILLLVLLGVFLGRLRFLGPGFSGDLNKLVFWIALPAFLFRSVVHAERPGPQTFSLLGLLVVATGVAAVAGWIAAGLLNLPHFSRGTLSQSAFRGNLAYIGIPVLAYAFEGLPGRSEAFGTAVIVTAFLMALYNVLAVVVLSIGQKSERPVPAALKSIFTNPLLLACMAGIPLAFTRTGLPLFLDRALESLGGAAVPIALLCIGGSLAHAKFGEKAGAILAAAVLKTLAVPVLVYFCSPFFGIAGTDLRIALVLSACPTAAVAFVMARQMNGDASLASGSIVLSTLLAAISIPLALFFSR
jgi:malate permease and related proteins